MPNIVELLKALSPHDLSVLLTILGSGGAVSVVLQIIKHFGKLQEAKKLVMFLLGMLSFLASFADWAIMWGGQNPKLVVGSIMGWIITSAVVIHRFSVSPIYHKLIEFLNGVYADAEAYRKEQTPQPVVPVAPLDMPTAPREFSVPN